METPENFWITPGQQERLDEITTSDEILKEGPLRRDALSFSQQSSL